jgi:tetratricopeptide (TPR) repeat protein
MSGNYVYQRNKETVIANLEVRKGELEAQPQSLERWLAYADALLACGRLADARNILMQARDYGHAPESIGLKQAKLDVLEGSAARLVDLFNRNQFDQLLALSLEWVEERPMDSFGWKVLGAVYSSQRKFDLAINALANAVALNPTDSEAGTNLSNAHYARADTFFADGRWADAESDYRRAGEFSLNTDNININIAACLYQQGKFDEAEALCKGVLAHNLTFAEAYNILGAVYNDMMRFIDAEPLLRKAIELKPDYAPAYLNLGITLKETGRFELAQAALQHALMIRPDDAGSYVMLADCFDNETQTANSQEAFNKALLCDPENVKALHGLGVLLTTKGQFDAAEIHLRKAALIAPDESGPWAALANIRKMSRSDEDWFKAAEAINSDQLRPSQRVALRFALGKAHDDIGDYDKAFDYYRRANQEAKGIGPLYDSSKQTANTDELCRIYSAEKLNRRSPAASPSMRPLFIVGMPRSGTSLTEQIIASHPDTYGAGELRFWRDSALRCAPKNPERTLDDDLISDIAKDCLANLERHSSTASRIVDKMPGNFQHVGLIHSVFPNARILHTQRNPIDTCLSIYFQNFNLAHSYAKDLNDLAHRYREYHRLIAHWRSILPSDVFLDVPYEALLEDQVGWSRKIIEFIGLEWDERCLRFYDTDRKVGTASNWQVRQPIYKSSKERWRNYEKYVEPLLPLLELRNDLA